MTSAFKFAAAFAQATRSRKVQSTFTSRRSKKKLPTVSVMVPLFHEREIAGRLIKRLSRLTYPRELLDICLVVEEDDTITQDAVARTELPRWMRMIVVPRGDVKTKPRALNFALDFCRGSLIGIYDAEDAPEPDQIQKVAYHFNNAAPEVACVQGILDFYNSRTNWLARCFTVEYASWFRVILPGYERLGLVVPLGGTTLFFRRDAIEKLGGWDAHNVTEDADLGIRLARHGYRTELIRTVTDEEANCRMWPWVKQRSRWLKGYAMTWAMHMRNPRQLLQDLGWWKFIGVQVLFFGSLSNAVLAPLLWSFWLLPLGFHHPLQGLVPNEAFICLGALFLLSEVVTMAIGMVATSTPKHNGMWKWVPTLHFYYPLGTLAAIKGLWEVMTRPYYWDKTAHGLHDLVLEDEADALAEESIQPPILAVIDGASTALNGAVIQNQATENQNADGQSIALDTEAGDNVIALRSAKNIKNLYPEWPTQKGKPFQRSFDQRPFERQAAVGFAEAGGDFEAAPQDLINMKIPRHPARRLTFGMDLTEEAHENVPDWLQYDVHSHRPERGLPIDTARLRPAPKASDHHINDLSSERPEASIRPAFYLPAEMSQTAAFVQIPDFLPSAKDDLERERVEHSLTPQAKALLR